MRGNGILLNDQFDVQVQPVRDTDGKIISGLMIGSTLYQNQALILTLHPGAVKMSPLTGVGIADVILDNDLSVWERTIRLQMGMDQQRVNKVIFSSNNVQIDGEYNH